MQDWKDIARALCEAGVEALAVGRPKPFGGMLLNGNALEAFRTAVYRAEAAFNLENVLEGK